MVAHGQRAAALGFLYAEGNGAISKENNYEELAYETVRLEISIGDNPYKGNDIPMMVAKRDQVSDIIAL